MSASPYLAPGFYDRALADGRHRDIVGGRWSETAAAQMALLLDEGLRPEDRLLDIGCGCLRLGHRAAAYLAPGHYWGTDASLALMRRGHEAELSDETRARLPPGNLVEDADFGFPGLPDSIDIALAFAVFTHLPPDALPRALAQVRARFPRLRRMLLTVFLAPQGHAGPHRQPDGVVTHPDRPPWHRPAAQVEAEARAAGFTPDWRPRRLPRSQRLLALTPV
ncbi:methyltransferase [Rhodobacter sp. Har01]|uniref:class I SAM-dependent methyltransferase n=1 Tax=Rhodobacter sp. Har01 TaxID=2883999 RepID=UPI001D06E382|nr:class I SAM-dependent methyltransferase [Rhodobacter sp. Har01]MCB6178524.1 methyltransferase [Rhodobacter sp. Har01]